MVRRPPPEAILFDLDNTLTDRSASIACYAPRFAADFPGLTTNDTHRITRAIQQADAGGYRGRPEVAAAIRAALRWRGDPPSIDVLVAHWAEHFRHCAAPVVGCREVLHALRERGYKLGLITNGRTVGQQAKLDALGITDRFETITISEAIGCDKPDPRIFRHAAGQLGLAPTGCWFVGDHPVNDIDGAAAVGMTAIWSPAQQPWPADSPPPPHQLTALTDLIPLLDRASQNPA